MGANDRFSQTIRKKELGEHAPFELRPLAGGRRVGDSTPLSPRPSDAERAKDGYAAGREQGYADAQRDVQRARAVDLQRLEALMASLQGEFDQLAARTADALLDLAVDIAAQVLRQEVQTRREAILPVVHEALGLLQAARAHPTVRLAPIDFETVRTAMQSDGQFQGCRFVADASIAPGGCRVESASGEVDATLPVRWRRVLQTLGVDAPLANAADGPESTPASGADAPRR
jgi:flagellar assembly protein FliH